MKKNPALHLGESLSYWIDSTEAPKCSSLNQDLEVDVCIVGAGLGGITSAYLLQKEGLKVCVLESFEVGSGQTGRTTAQFSYALDDRYYQLARYHGAGGAKLAAESHRAALQQVAKIVEEEKIDCEFSWVSGYLFDPPKGEAESEEATDHSGRLQEELKAIHEAGLREVVAVERAPLPDFDTGLALHFPKQIELHPLKYLNALAQIVIKNGGQIFTHTHAVEVSGGKEAFVKTKSGFTVKARQIIMATNSPTNDQFAIHTKQSAYRTYVIGAKIPKGSVPRAFYWDTLDPYHYVRFEDDEKDATSEWLIVGGEDHKTGQEENPLERYQKLEEWMRKRFPKAGEVSYQWSGQVMEPVDGLGFLGHNPLDRNNIYVITGDSGNGMTHTTLGGMIICDQIMGRANEWEKLYHPSRISLRAAAEFVKENANVAAQYRDWATNPSIKHVEEIKPGEGAVFRDGVKMVAAYRNQKGELKKLSAVCPHLGGVVRFNEAENSWDCPCHGSRFDLNGKVIEGPSIAGLAEA